MSKKRPAKTGSPAHYRQKAEEMLRQAEAASSPEIRAQLLKLADHWHRLAQALEQPNW